MHREWGEWMRGLNHQGAWYYRRLVWTDICNKILPLSEPKANEQALARKAYMIAYMIAYIYIYIITYIIAYIIANIYIYIL